MDKQKIFFENLKRIKDNWVNSATEGLDPKADLIWSNVEDKFRKLQELIKSNQEKDAFRVVLNDIIMGVMHSLLVMVDGGDTLADKFNIDLIDEETKESLKENITLHDEFYSYLVDIEE